MRPPALLCLLPWHVHHSYHAHCTARGVGRCRRVQPWLAVGCTHAPTLSPTGCCTPSPARRFSAFVAKGIVDDLTGYYNTQQRKFYSIIRWGRDHQVWGRGRGGGRG